MPDSPAGVTVEGKLCDSIMSVASSIASCLAGAQVEVQQACYLPMSSDGVPVIGQLPGVEGAYIATGHSCWGILNGPATGLAMAELLAYGEAKAVDLRAFSPARFRLAAGRR